jgi:hypothetical protein
MCHGWHGDTPLKLLWGPLVCTWKMKLCLKIPVLITHFQKLCARFARNNNCMRSTSKHTRINDFWFYFDTQTKNVSSHRSHAVRKYFWSLKCIKTHERASEFTKKNISGVEISIMFCFFYVGLHFSLFFSPANFSRLSLDQFSPSLAWTCLLACDLNRRWLFFEKFKTRSQRPTNVEKQSIFRPHGHVFVRYDETVKYFT